jgi:hypothetical protein
MMHAVVPLDGNAHTVGSPEVTGIGRDLLLHTNDLFTQRHVPFWAAHGEKGLN